MGGFGKVMLYTRWKRKVDAPALCDALRAMEIPDPIDSVIWRRYPGELLRRLRALGERAEEDPEVWDEILDISDQVSREFHKRVSLDAVPDLVRDEPCWHLLFNGYPFGDRLPQEWKSVPESIRGKTNDYGCGITIGPHVQAILRRGDFESVRVFEASFSMHFSGYPGSNDSVNAMKSLPTLQLIRERLEPTLGPLEVEATWSF